LTFVTVKCLGRHEGNQRWGEMPICAFVHMHGDDVKCKAHGAPADIQS
jgi:hypothetical protein